MGLITRYRAAFINEQGRVLRGSTHDDIISSVNMKKYPTLNNLDSWEAMQEVMIAYGWAGIVNDEETLMLNFGPKAVTPSCLITMKKIVTEQAEYALKKKFDLEVILIFAKDRDPEHNTEKFCTPAEALKILDNKSKWK